MSRTGSIAAMLALLAISCGSDQGVDALDAWARPTPGVAETAAVYVSLSNNTNEEDAVVAASSDRCGSMQIHETVIVDDVMRMEHLGELVLPPVGTIIMEPGGFHLMCVMVREPFTGGDTIEVDLELRSGPTKTVSVEIEER